MNDLAGAPKYQAKMKEMREELEAWMKKEETQVLLIPEKPSRLPNPEHIY